MSIMESIYDSFEARRQRHLSAFYDIHSRINQTGPKISEHDHKISLLTGADTGLLERGPYVLKVWGFA